MKIGLSLFMFLFSLSTLACSGKTGSVQTSGGQIQTESGTQTSEEPASDTSSIPAEEPSVQGATEG